MDDETLPTTPDEYEAWLRAKVDEFGLTGWRRTQAFTREGDSFRLEMNFYKQLCETVPAVEEQREQRAHEIWEEIARREAERLEDVGYVLPKLKGHIAELSIAQANDPAWEGDTLLGTLIANLGEDYQALAERIEQLKQIVNRRVIMHKIYWVAGNTAGGITGRRTGWSPQVW
jgi:hypothetical protein